MRQTHPEFALPYPFSGGVDDPENGRTGAWNWILSPGWSVANYPTPP